MENEYFLDFIPLWALFPLTIALIATAMELGFRIGAWRREHGQQEKEATVGAVVAATLGLLGFMLAITFGIAVSRFDFRRQAFLGEVNMVSSAYLYADLLPANERDQIRSLLRDYIDVRIRTVNSQNFREGIAQSEQLHKQLWAATLRAVDETRNFFAVGIFAQTLNGVFDAHTKRIFAAFDSRIPAIIWLVLYGIAMLGTAVLGYQAALGGSNRSPTFVGLVIAFAAVLMLVADLDRPQGGLLRVSQKAMTDLQALVQTASS